MPQHFSKLGISFLFPDNWTLDDGDAVAGAKSVTVYSPGGAFWSVSVHPASAEPEMLAQAAVQAIRDEYAEVEAEPTFAMTAGQKLVGFDLAFYYLDLTNTACVRCFRTPGASYAVFYQAEDHEFTQFEQVFAAMTRSLLEGIQRRGAVTTTND